MTIFNNILNNLSILNSLVVKYQIIIGFYLKTKINCINGNNIFSCVVL